MPRQMKESNIEWLGRIPSEWRVIKLKYIFSVIGGNGFPDALQGKNVGEYPFCKVSDINGMEEYVSSAVNYVDEVTVSKNKFNVVPQFSIIMAKIGAALMKNHRKINSVPCCIDNNTQALVPKRDDNIRYLFYLSKCLDMKWFDNNSTVPSINNNRLLNLYVPDITREDQDQIALFLDAKCKEIDSILSQISVGIEEYKKLKASLVTEAVTKGIRGSREMKESGVEWLGSIPFNWNVYRIANLYDERSESGLEELPILTVSINTGVSDHEIADEDKDRVFVRSEDRTKYKRVYPGDLAYNMMRAWQGAFGAVRVDGMVSPAYVVAKPKKNVKLDSRYMEALLRTSEATEEMHRYSRGIVDFRLRLYWPEFKNIRICLPPIEEQIEIADYIDEKSAAIDALIAKKEAFAAELENYKKSMIYEYVTGKKEVPQS